MVVAVVKIPVDRVLQISLEEFLNSILGPLICTIKVIYVTFSTVRNSQVCAL